jgi:hypothetical protein
MDHDNVDTYITHFAGLARKALYYEDNPTVLEKFKAGLSLELLEKCMHHDGPPKLGCLDEICTYAPGHSHESKSTSNWWIDPMNPFTHKGVPSNPATNTTDTSFSHPYGDWQSLYNPYTMKPADSERHWATMRPLPPVQRLSQFQGTVAQSELQEF